MKTNNKIISEMLERGLSLEEIRDCLDDGQYLGEAGITQEEVEDADVEIRLMIND